MSTTGTVARILSVLLVLAGSALASPVVARDNIFECIYHKSMKFTSIQAAAMRAEGPTCYPLGVDPKDFGVFLEDCCNQADANHQSHGSPALFDAVSGDKKAADNVDKLSAPGEKLSSTHVDDHSVPSVHDPSSHANANVDSSPQNGNFDPSLRTGENNGPDALENASTGENTGAPLSRLALKKAAVDLSGPPSIPDSARVDKSQSAPVSQKDSSPNANPSQHGDADVNSSPSPNANGNGNTDVDPSSLRTGEKNPLQNNASDGLRTGVKPTNEQPDLAKNVAAAADFTPGGERHSLLLSAPTAPKNDVAVDRQSTTNANANTHANGNTDPKVAADAHSQSTTPAVEKTDSVPMLGAIGGDEKCKCPL